MTGAFSRNKGARAERPAGDWKECVGWSGYWVSADGRVWSVFSGRLLAGSVSRDGYRKIHLSGEEGYRIRFVHRLVAEAFLPGSGEQVRHIDGDKQNNVVSNLEWGTASENIMDKWRHGKMPHGERHHSNKIPEAEIDAIRRSAESNAALGKKYGVSRTAIYLIRKGANYGWKA